MKRIAGVIVLALALFVGATSDHAPQRVQAPLDSGEALTKFLSSIADRLTRQSPETITTRGLSKVLGVRNDALDSLVVDRTGESYAPLEQALARIESANLGREDARSRRAIEAYAAWLRNALDGRPYLDDVCLVSTYMTSYPQHLAWFMTHIHPLETKADADDYLARLAQIPARFDELVVRLAASEARSALAPRFLLLYAADEIDAVSRGPDGRPELLTHFAAALAGMADLDSETRQALLDDAERVILNIVRPAYARLAGTVREFAAHATDDIGIWRLPDGDAYYAYLLRSYTTTDVTADEIYDLGLREVARIQGEIRDAATALGYNPSLTIPDLFAALRATSGVISGDDTVRACRDLVAEAAARARPAFLALPGALPAVEAGENIAYFVAGAEDGSRPGVFYVPASQVRPIYSLRSLVAHETIPGHFLQAAAAQHADLPDYLDGVAFSGYTEGWATYAERLAWELGAYEDDPYGNLGRLQEELFRAARLVVDPGIHAKRWTYEQAVTYMIETTGLEEGTVHDEVDRYVVTPGQAVAYGVGLYTLLELRERARDALGPAFDLAQFHQAVLSCGSVPFTVLEEVVDEFIASHLPTSVGNSCPSERQRIAPADLVLVYPRSGPRAVFRGAADGPARDCR